MALMACEDVGMSEKVLYKRKALLFGHDESLLLSRKWLLASAGCECTVVANLAEYREKVLGCPVELIIICQTTSPDECSSAAEFATEHQSQAQLLIMFGRSARCVPEHEYVMLDAMAGPAVFMQPARRMLANAATRADLTA